MKINSNKGITLIALVITVIVLLILAGTAISISISGGNIFEKSNTAVSSANAKAVEQTGNIIAVGEAFNTYTDKYTTSQGSEPQGYYGEYATESEAENNWYTYEIITPTIAKADGIVSSVKVADNSNRIRVAENNNTMGTAMITGTNPEVLFSDHEYDVSKIVIPAIVKLNENGEYDEENGLEYKIVKIADNFIEDGDWYGNLIYDMTTLVIPNTVTEIGDEAFEYCQFTTVYIPSSVTKIGEDAFAHCENLENIIYDASRLDLSEAEIAYYYTPFYHCPGCQHGIWNVEEYQEQGHTCQLCGAIFDHDWNDTVCLICGLDHIHEYNWDTSECTICGQVCPHNWQVVQGFDEDENGNSIWEHSCTICEAWGYHNYVDGVCDECGYVCLHDFDPEYSECNICGITCSSHDYRPALYAGGNDPESHECSICGHYDEHDFENGVCTVCGYECEHNFEWGPTCSYCGMTQ